ncbi:hypothetical protein GCM10010260_07160 [Streptomyces filipinensis]|uniref:Uncharacterized protein n=1 Tax=Streptomyces filipinensis TaxID=66887 RepID=A0A918M909_9ACTN|nr:hypothetical protein GCM10010260_07160 [Streptomyces filipinensis]
MKETDTENLLRRGQGVARMGWTTCCGRMRRRRGPEGSWRLATSSRQAAAQPVRNDPFY